MLRVGIITVPLVCRGFTASGTLYGCIIYLGVSVIFCLFIGKVFSGPKRRTGRVKVHAFIVSFGDG